MKNKIDKENVSVPESVNEPVATPASTPKYDGVETWEERDVMGQVTKFTRKINMSDDEVAKFLGGHDPHKYFRNGKVPISYKSMGVLLPEDREEVMILRQTMPSFPDVLLFKHNYEQLYQLLIPKNVCEFELDGNNDIVDESIRCDTRSIVFGGTGTPRSFERTYFKQRVQVINLRLKSVADMKINYNLTNN